MSKNNNDEKVLLIFNFCFTGIYRVFTNTAVRFTLEDRDRIMRTGQEIKLLRNEMSIKFENRQQQIDDLKKALKM